ncbi:hypothetical protein [Mesorhizobium sp.]|uniref:hypothetical protein n=1 Tax=Mesorhizobium sp. TaxID=1871066 RepID=UPI00122AE24A|nr:hypothetical protein [Mesorhizobium sp.]TIS88767.1 MAG: hypothetical protein E5W89_19140 [Mesorhizobium sp.]TJW36615.1 MAG: hypothetical protein E5W83_33680 [Mesorhizobium sp.]
MSQRNDLTIDEAVQDPMIRMLMKADRVDPGAFEAMLRSLVAAQGERRKAQSSHFLEDSGSARRQRLSRAAKGFGNAKAFSEACVSW